MFSFLKFYNIYIQIFEYYNKLKHKHIIFFIFALF